MDGVLIHSTLLSIEDIVAVKEASNLFLSVLTV